MEPSWIKEHQRAAAPRDETVALHAEQRSRDHLTHRSDRVRELLMPGAHEEVAVFADREVKKVMSHSAFDRQEEIGSENLLALCDLASEVLGKRPADSGVALGDRLEPLRNQTQNPSVLQCFAVYRTSTDHEPLSEGCRA